MLKVERHIDLAKPQRVRSRIQITYIDPAWTAVEQSGDIARNDFDRGRRVQGDPNFAVRSCQDHGYVIDAGRDVQCLQNLWHCQQIFRPIPRTALILMPDHCSRGCVDILLAQTADAKYLRPEQGSLYRLGCTNVKFVSEESELDRQRMEANLWITRWINIRMAIADRSNNLGHPHDHFC